MMDIEKQLYMDIVNLYKKSETQTKYRPVRFLQMLNSGAKPSEVVKRMIYVEGGRFDFEILKKMKRLDLSVEAIVLKKEYDKLFSDEERKWCQKRLENSGYDFKAQN